MNKKDKRKVNIDSGWAWVVMIATYLGTIFLSTALYMNGVINVELLERYGASEAKTSLVGALCSGILCLSLEPFAVEYCVSRWSPLQWNIVSLVGALCSGILCCAAPLVGALNNKVSCRFSVVIGGATATICFAACAFVSSINTIIFNGIFVGIGFAQAMPGLVCAVGFYFEKYRSIILSVIFSTVGISMFISATFGLYLLKEFGLRGTYFILASIIGQICVVGMLSRPSMIEREIQRQNFRKLKKATNKVISFIDVTLPTKKSYLCILISISTWNFGLSAGSIHLPNYVSVLSGRNSDISFVMLLFAVSNFVGRICGSLSISRLHSKCTILYICELGTAGVNTLLFPLFSKITGGLHVFAGLGFSLDFPTP